MMMTGVAMAGLVYRPRSRVLGTIGWVSLGLFTVYLLNAYVLYFFARP
jgi:cation:H+ antiporter